PPARVEPFTPDTLRRRTLGRWGCSARAQAPQASSPVSSTGCQPLVHLKGVALDLIGQQHSVVAHGRDYDAGQLDGAAVRLCAEGSVVCASDPERRGDPGPVTVLERVDYLGVKVPDGRAEVLDPLLECLATFDPAASGNDDEVLDDEVVDGVVVLGRLPHLLPEVVNRVDA